MTARLSRCEAALTTASAPLRAARRPSAPSPGTRTSTFGVRRGDLGRAGLVAVDQDHPLDAVARSPHRQS